nr:CASP-like protein 1E2 [Ipomoea batatas]GMD87026.1 CASP-like protein 1E2 [Ipomoea batatas]GMD93426.1 CASP-like protein 1E2 [Ipomoea batatas]GME15050.1 CASP-like protein 1E2 [Ipomoea batatas]
MEVGGGQVKELAVAKKQNMRWTEFGLRLLAFANTLAAALVLGLDKQTKVVVMQIIPTLPAMNIPVTAEWKYMSAFVYFVVVNAIACAYAFVSLVLTLVCKGQKSSRVASLVLIVLDLVMVALLFSSGGAAFAVGLLGYKGNSHVRWNKVCNVFGKFCAQVGGAVTVSLAAAAFFLLLVLLAIFKLHNKHH